MTKAVLSTPKMKTQLNILRLNVELLFILKGSILNSHDGANGHY